MDAFDPNAAWHGLGPREQFAWYGFLRAFGTLVPALDEELQQAYHLPLTSYELLLLLSLAPNQQLTMSDLAGRMLFSPSGLTRLVERLEREGMVARQPGQIDSRQKLATITARGLGWLADAHQFHVAGIRRRFFDKLAVDQIAYLAALWLRLVPPLTEAARELGSPPSPEPELQDSITSQMSGEETRSNPEAAAPSGP